MGSRFGFRESCHILSGSVGISFGTREVRWFLQALSLASIPLEAPGDGVLPLETNLTAVGRGVLLRSASECLDSVPHYPPDAGSENPAIAREFDPRRLYRENLPEDTQIIDSHKDNQQNNRDRKISRVQ